MKVPAADFEDPPESPGDLEDLLRAAQPPPADVETVRRLSGGAIRRLQRRRRRLGAGLSLAAVVLMGVMFLMARHFTGGAPGPDRFPPPAGVVREDPRRPLPLTHDHDDELVKRTVSEAVAVVAATEAVRRRVTDRLRRLGTRGVPYLLDEVTLGGDRARAAAQLLAALGTRRASEATLDVLTVSRDADVVRAILQEIMRRDGWRARRLIRDLVAVDRIDVTPVCLLIIAHLERVRGRLAGELLQEVGRFDSIPVRAQVIRALAPRSPRAAARIFITSSTACVGPEGDAGRLPGFCRDVLPGLGRPTLTAISDELQCAIRVRSRTNRRQGRPPGESHHEGGDVWLAGFAAGLGQSGVAEAWPLLETILEATDLASVALEACGRLGDERAVPYLGRALQLPNHTSLAAAEALGAIPGRDSLTTLLAGFQAIDRTTAAIFPVLGSRRQTLAELLRSRRVEAIAELKQAIHGGPLRWATISTFTELFADEAARELAGLLFTARRGDQQFIMRGLAELDRPEATAAMLRALEVPALARTARRCLIRLAGQDLGPRPEAWRRWLERRLEGTSDGNKPRSRETLLSNVHAPRSSIKEAT